MKHKITNSILVVAKLAVTAGILWYVFHGIDVTSILHTLVHQRPLPLALATLMVVLQIVVGAERWRILLKGISNHHATLPIVAVHKVYYSSIFFNNCMPGTLGGDVMRAWLAKALPISFGLKIFSIVLDRLFALTGLVILAVITLPFVEHPVAKLAFAVGVLIVVGAVVGLAVMRKVRRFIGRWHERKAIHTIIQFINTIEHLIHHPRYASLALFYGVLSQAIHSITVYYVADSMGVNIGVIPMLALIPLVVLITIIPISIGGWGLREASMIGILSSMGVSSVAALTISIEMGTLAILVGALGGIPWILQKKKVLATSPA